MMDCKFLTQDMLSHPVMVRVDDYHLDLMSAKTIADHKARELSSDPMLLAWFDRKTGEILS